MPSRAEQIVGRERRERVSQLAWCSGGCFDSRRRVNSTVRRFPWRKYFWWETASQMLKRLFFVIIHIYGALDVTSKAALVRAKPQRRPKDEAVFIFQNNFWVNLHHFVRGESRRRMLNIPLELPLSELSQNERTSWEGALDTYVEFAKRNLIFDESLIQIDNILAQVTDTAVLRATGIQPNILAALNSVAEVYRAHRWQEHSRENELWIAAHGPAIRLHVTRRYLWTSFAISDRIWPTLLRDPKARQATL